MRRLINTFMSGWAAFVIAASITGTALAEDAETVIRNLGGAPFAGPVVDPSSGVIYVVYGGLIYRLSPPIAGQSKWAYKLIYNNPGTTTSPINVATNFVYASNGVVYAEGYNDSENSGEGVYGIFSLTPPASGTGEWTPTVLHAFSSATDGSAPVGPLTMDTSGALYGTANQGGAGTGCGAGNGGCGTVFKLTPPAAQGQAWSFFVLYTFAGGVGGQKPQDGVILDKDGNLYGSAPFAYPSGKSLIFKLTPPTGAGEWTKSILYRFYPTSGCYSSGPLAIDANGALYGAFSPLATSTSSCTDLTETEYAFQLAPSQSDPNVWVRTYMHWFTTSDVAGGYYLRGPLTVDAGGNVYGATLRGGTADTGTVFALRPRAKVAGKWNYQTLFDFATTTGHYNVNTTGAAPDGGLVFDTAGNLYGATISGGSGGRGVLFSLTR